MYYICSGWPRDKNLFFQKRFIYVYLKVGVTERERDFLSTGPLPRWLQWPKLGSLKPGASSGFLSARAQALDHQSRQDSNCYLYEMSGDAGRVLAYHIMTLASIRETEQEEMAHNVVSSAT